MIDNLHDDSPEMIEVVARGVRRLLHAADPALAIEPAAPFDLASEVDALRAAALRLTPGLVAGRQDLLAFLHREPASQGPFDRAIWLETMALASSSATRATDALGAQIYALSAVLRHAMTHNQLVEALRQGRAEWAALGVTPDSIDLSLATPEDRRRHAMRDALGIGFFLEEYHGSSEPEPSEA